MTAPTDTRTCPDCAADLTTTKATRGRCHRCYKRQVRAGLITVKPHPGPKRRTADTVAAYFDLTELGYTTHQIAERLGFDSIDGLTKALYRAKHAHLNVSPPDHAPAPAVGPVDIHTDRRAACRDVDPEWFFTPEGLQGPAKHLHQARAKQVCAGCPLINACRDWAVANDVRYGVWGGLSEDDRGKPGSRGVAA